MVTRRERPVLRSSFATEGGRAYDSVWEDRCFSAPKGLTRIAQRFNAGLAAKKSRVPKGRLRSNHAPHPSAFPSGLVCHAGCFPALKRRSPSAPVLKMGGAGHPPAPQSATRRPELPRATLRKGRAHWLELSLRFRPASRRTAQAGRPCYQQLRFSNTPSGTEEQGDLLFRQASNPIH